MTSPNQERATPPTPSTTRPKRSKVSRACDLCRVLRVRCTGDSPCPSCEIRKVECKYSAVKRKAVFTLASAKEQIEELEAEIDVLRQQISNGLPETTQQRTASGTQSPIEPESTTDLEDGISALNLRTNNAEYYGASSSYYFTDKLYAHLCGTQNDTVNDGSSIPPDDKPSARMVDEPTLSTSDPLPSFAYPTNDVFEIPMECADHYIDIFWHTTHPMVAIFDEWECRKYYEAIKALGNIPNQGPLRRWAPVIDMIIALGAQFERSASKTPEVKLLTGPDVQWGGSNHFIRARNRLGNVLETAQLSTIRCLTLMHLWLYNAARVHEAYNTLGLAIRAAHGLGLHRENFATEMTSYQRELQRRCWWALYYCDIKLSIELGRPLATQIWDIDLRYPVETEESININPQYPIPCEDISWITFHRQAIRLATLCLRGYRAVYSRRAVGNIATRAKLLSTSLEALTQWKEQVPKGLHLRPEATDPVWLERQRLSLYLWHNNIKLILHRPFLKFNNNDSPELINLANECLNIACDTTSTIFRYLTNTTVLDGWYEAYYYQWNATLILIAFIIAYPLSSNVEVSRQSISLALHVFKGYAATYPVAEKAHLITQNLFGRIDPVGWLGLPLQIENPTTTVPEAADLGLFSDSWEQMNWDFLTELPEDHFMQLDTFDQLLGGSPNPFR